MFVKHKISDLQYFRKPTQNEINLIYKWFFVQNTSQIKFNKRIGITFLVLGILCSILMLGSSTLSNVITFLLFIVLFIVLSISSFKDSKKRNILNDTVKSGDFLVVTGTAVEVTSGANKVDCVLVRFKSNDGCFTTGPLRVRYENVYIGSPLILVRVKYGKSKYKYKTLTKFMLSEAGFRALV